MVEWGRTQTVADGSDQLVFAIRGDTDGDPVTPATVDAGEAIELAGAYFELIRKLSERAEVELKLVGLAVRTGSAEVVSSVMSNDNVSPLLADAQKFVDGRAVSPRGATEAVKRMRALLGRMPPTRRVAVSYRGSEMALSVPSGGEVEAPNEVTTIRATLMRVGGADPVARFKSASEVEDVFIDVSEKQAIELAHYLYGDMDIEIRHTRGAAGKIEAAELVHFVPLQGTAEAWRTWFRATEPGWDSVEDVEGELDRHRH